MKDMNDIRKFIQTRCSNREAGPLVLCTLVHKSGSSYRGVGAKKIVSANSSLGFLSGGCLEASIEKTARERADELPFIASFSTLAEEDRLLGYQTGCQGVIDILFEQISVENLELQLPYGEQAKFNFVRVSLSDDSLGERRPVDFAHKDANVLFEPWVEPVRLFIVGCGADADVFAPLAQAMGWSATFLDYRGSLMSEGRFAPHQAQTVALNEIASHIPNGKRVAVVLMTHNYEADLEILRQMKDHHLGYLGCLGPAPRFERLQTDLIKMHGEYLGDNLLKAARAPAGIFTHGQSPEEIALSVTAQVQFELIEKPKDRNWTLILAAGASSRFGSSKALAKMGETTLLSRALKTAGEFSGENVFLVTGAQDFSSALNRDLNSARNPHWQEGMGRSIAFGVAKILEQDPKAATITILPVDQPFVTAAHLEQLAKAAQGSQRCALTSASRDQILSPPATIPRSFFPLCQTLQGDRGLKSILRADQYVCVENNEATKDIDHPADLHS